MFLRKLPGRNKIYLRTGAQGRNQLFISGGQFSWNFIRWRHEAYSTVVQLFRKRSQIKFAFARFNSTLMLQSFMRANWGLSQKKLIHEQKD